MNILHLLARQNPNSLTKALLVGTILFSSLASPFVSEVMAADEAEKEVNTSPWNPLRGPMHIVGGAAGPVIGMMVAPVICGMAFNMFGPGGRESHMVAYSLATAPVCVPSGLVYGTMGGMRHIALGMIDTVTMGLVDVSYDSLLEGIPSEAP